MPEVRDHNGNPLNEGSHVEAWLDGVRYTARVKTIQPHHPGCGDYRHIALVRDDDHTEVQGFSDSVAVIAGPEKQAPEGAA
jgi:hypothetical protein